MKTRQFSRACLVLVLGLGVLAQATLHARRNVPSLFTGRWTGPWVDASGTQGGTMDVTIDAYGSMTGLITNGTLRGTWRGRIGNDGSIAADYQYAGQQLLYPYVARGVWGMNAAGQLMGRLEFLSRGQRIGLGVFTLTASGGRSMLQVPQSANPLAIYPYGIFSYLNAIPAGGGYLAQHGFPNINEYRQNPRGYIDSIVPGYSSAVSGALEDISRLRAAGITSSNSVQNTIGMVNRMMRDAMRLSPAEVQRKYRGMNALAGAIAAQNEIYNSYHRHLIERQAADAQSQAAMQAFEAQMAEWRAAWTVWESQLARGVPVPSGR